MRKQFQDRFAFERDLQQCGIVHLAGVDEAGRGPLAGPVVAGAVCFSHAWLRGGLPSEFRGLNDSKQLSATERNGFHELLTTTAEIQYGLGIVDAELIDQINILQATHRAMRLALAQLNPPPEHVLVDGLPVKSLGYPQTALVKGDARSYSIAAASIIAKVTRDRLMLQYDRLYPTYGFAEHKGYPTPRHLACLAQRGPCPIHRRSFAPLRPVELSLFPDEPPPTPAPRVSAG